jgi:hypothetical protein
VFDQIAQQFEALSGKNYLLMTAPQLLFYQIKP